MLTVCKFLADFLRHSVGFLRYSGLWLMAVLLSFFPLFIENYFGHWKATTLFAFGMSISASGIISEAFYLEGPEKILAEKILRLACCFIGINIVFVLFAAFLYYHIMAGTGAGIYFDNEVGFAEFFIGATFSATFITHLLLYSSPFLGKNES